MRWLDGITDSMDMSLSELRELSDGQGGLACCDSWGRKKSDTTERLNWNETKKHLQYTHKKGKRWSRPCPCPVLIENSISWHSSTAVPVMFKKLICSLSDEIKQTIFSAEATGLIRSYRLVILNNRLSRNQSRSHHRCAVLQSQQKTHLSLSSIRENIPFSPAPLERER